MILKVRDENGWHCIDNIKRVYYQKIIDKGYHSSKKSWDKMDADLRLIDPTDRKDSIMLTMCVFKGNDGSFTILTDFVIYLCNDEGKTIEKVIA